MAAQKQVKGWFDLPGRPGDRKLADQLTGLGWLFQNCKGKRILDLGCAEGLIDIELAKAGALSVHGVELVPDRVRLANKIASRAYITNVCSFECADVENWVEGYTTVADQVYDIVIGLAILHKLREPARVARMLGRLARQAVVLRLPPYEVRPVIVDRRSGFVPQDIDGALKLEGLLMTASETGYLGEYIGVWERT